MKKSVEDKKGKWHKIALLLMLTAIILFSAIHFQLGQTLQGLLSNNPSFDPGMIKNSASTDPITLGDLAKELVYAMGVDVRKYSGCARDLVGNTNEQYVCYLVDQGVLAVNQDNRILPDSFVQRGVAAKYFYGSFLPMNYYYMGNALVYEDVEPDSWFYSHVNTVGLANMTDVIPNSGQQFRPGDFITYAEVDTWISNTKSNTSINSNLLSSQTCKENIGPLVPINDNCSKNTYKLAFVVLVEPGQELKKTDAAFLSLIRKELSERFFTATDNKVALCISNQNFYIELDQLALDEINTSGYTDLSKIIPKFYRKYGNDDFDFLAVIYGFEPSHGNFTPGHITVRQKIKGIGLPVKDEGSIWGSRSNLLSVISMGYKTGIYMDLDGIEDVFIHELGHHWCCYMGTTKPLQISRNDGHFSEGLSTPYDSNIMSYVDSYLVFDKSNGTYEKKYNSYPIKFHPFVLYMMGVLPPIEYSNEYDLFEIVDDINATWLRTVSVNNIIDIEGPRTCENENNKVFNNDPPQPLKVPRT